jgi:hypothetical protein
MCENEGSRRFKSAPLQQAVDDVRDSLGESAKSPHLLMTVCLLLEFYSGAGGPSGRFSEGFSLRRFHEADHSPCCRPFPSLAKVRCPAQSVHGFWQEVAGFRSLVNEGSSRIVKFIIKESAISDTRKSLDTLGISESTVFPDLDGLGRELRLAFEARRRRE